MAHNLVKEWDKKMGKKSTIKKGSSSTREVRAQVLYSHGVLEGMVNIDRRSRQLERDRESTDTKSLQK